MGLKLKERHACTVEPHTPPKDSPLEGQPTMTGKNIH